MFVDVDEPAVEDLDDLCAHGVHVLLCDDARCLDPGAPTEPAPAIDPGLLPGARLALQLQTARAETETLTPGEVLDTIEAAAIQERWTAGLRIRMLAEFAHRHPADTPSAPLGADRAAAMPSRRWVPDEIGLTLGTSRLEALGEIAQAERFVQVLPDTLALLEQGRIDLRRAEALARATAVLPDELARQVEAVVLPKAPDSTPKQMQDRIRRAIAKVDPDGEYRRHTAADRGRRVAPRTLEDGMASLWCYGSAAEIEAAWTMIDRLARSLPAQDPRTLDQRRFDLTVQLLTGRLTVTDLVDVDAAVTDLLTTEAPGPADPGETGSGRHTGRHDADGRSCPTARAAAETSGDDSTAEGGTDEPGADESGSGESDVDESGVGETGAGETGTETTNADESAATTADAEATGTAGTTGDQTPAADQMDLTDQTLSNGRVTGQAGPLAGGDRVPPDVLADAVAEALSRRPDLHATERKPLVQVVLGIDTLLGSNRPAELVGHGPIDAVTARALAADAVIQRLLSDPMTGTVLEHGRSTYAPPAALADHVRSRDQICRGPRCTRRVRDLDHHQDWARDGDTDEDNLFGYCKHCHLLKDAPGWQVIAHPDRSLTWISPCGRRTTSEPFDYCDFTDDLPAWDGRPPPTATARDEATEGAGNAAGPTHGGTEHDENDAEADDPPPF
ncbi:MAG: HNH endonuclease [Actinomycetota bacterium]|nr:HNH endonuclease [Actinomycetota bacterium]